MKPQLITIKIEPWGPKHSDGYTARVLGQENHYGCTGASPDEALGYLIRDLWLSGHWPVVIDELIYPEEEPISPFDRRTAIGDDPDELEEPYACIDCGEPVDPDIMTCEACFKKDFPDDPS